MAKRRTEEESQALKAIIYEMDAMGDRGVDIATALGVSKQYVFQILKNGVGYSHKAVDRMKRDPL